MVADAKRVGHDRQSRVNCITGGEEAAIHDVKVFEIMCLAVRVEYRGLWIMAKARCPALMSDAPERDFARLFKMQPGVPLAEQVLQLGHELAMRFKVVRFVAQRGSAVASD